MNVYYTKNGEDAAFLAKIRSRAENVGADVETAVKAIISDVKSGGDAAVKRYTKRFDCPDSDDNNIVYAVPEALIDDALERAEPDFVSAMLSAIENVTAFHERQKQNGYVITKESGVMLGQRVRGLNRVGLYVPGGSAAYPSSVIMNAIPARIAGVSEIICVTPPQKDGGANPDILVAARLCGINRVFLCGGAQAVAALAYGTEIIPKVSKIVGPGNIYVATAKRLLYGVVDIDMIAGPSEILILADRFANPKYIACDLCSQAEHDAMASAILITTDKTLPARVNEELDKLVPTLPRKDIIEQSLQNYGGIIVAENLYEAIALAEDIAPEHMEILTENPFEFIGKIDNVGSLFLGEYSPEPLGDYYAGPNHVLPTSGTARFFSPLSVDSFVKKSSYIYYNRAALAEAAGDILTIAAKEGLSAHAKAIAIRQETTDE